MKISYEDAHRERRFDTEYIGTWIIVKAESKVEWEYIKAAFLYKSMPHKGSCFYKYEFGWKKLKVLGYDGFQASIIERDLTGDRKGWLNGKSETELERMWECKKCRQEINNDPTKYDKAVSESAG